ncbi:hypothetical protein OS493_031009 [Desmophyllum pertusum]|uniref:Uncharacterized protein n=1 Tax=Desmophyllum pertusum TaxID=174260 RepID=A0A9X0CVG1_9CNID|nr:hypothetical protein OS493_031009 [Desmophyllum pertusum]
MAEIPQPPLPKRHDLQTSADLERVTDYAEEQEISTTDIENAISLVEGRYSEEKAAKLQRVEEMENPESHSRKKFNEEPQRETSGRL